MIVLAKVKFDLRDPDELYFAQREIERLLETKVKLIITIASLFKEKPFNLLDDDVIHLISRLVIWVKDRDIWLRYHLRK